MHIQQKARCFIAAVLITLLSAARAFCVNEPPLPELIPTPVKVVSDAVVRLNPKARIVADADLAPLGYVLADEIHTAFGVQLPVVAHDARGGDIVLNTGSRLRRDQPEDGYLLSVPADDDNTFRISGATYDGVAAGTATLLQLMSADAGGCSIIGAHITDYSDYPYRSVLIDLGRQYHSAAGVEQVIELCRLYKLRYLQLHLSDDQLFAFRSGQFPNAGKTNSEFTRFEPASTSAPQPYALETWRKLEHFAAVRGVHLVPELDMPGHSGRLIADEPADFASKARGSTMNIASPRTRAAAVALLNEVMDVFQSTPYVHLGGDEVDLSGIAQTPEYLAAAQLEPAIKSPHDLYCQFVHDMCDAVIQRGKSPIVWEEGFNPDGPFALPSNTIVMSWSMGRDPDEIARRGYRIINASWTPLYIVRANRKSVPLLCDWNPLLFGRENATEYTRLGDKSHLLGAQLCSWENSECAEMQSLRQRAAVVSEQCWTYQKRVDLGDITPRLSHCDALLDRLISPIKLELSHAAKDEDTFDQPVNVTLTARDADPSLHIRYTLDNTLPDATWKNYDGPITISRSAHLRAGLFDDHAAQHGYLLGYVFRSRMKVQDNLATGRPVSVGPGPDRTDGWFARLAVDGFADDRNAHWAAGDPGPQWLQVDFGQVQPLDRLTLITYWDNSRYYQYTVDVSDDGKQWRQVVDASTNTAPATADGYSSRFEKTHGRYVRVNMLKNSANPFVHIVELIVPKAQ